MRWSHLRAGAASVLCWLLLVSAPILAAQKRSAIRITLEKARALALHTLPGRLLAQNFEFIHRRWLYEFSIRRQHTHLVYVDAHSGSVFVDSAPGRPSNSKH